MREYEYDVTLSFAGEDREHAEKIRLNAMSIGVQISPDTYVMFVSEHLESYDKDHYYGRYILPTLTIRPLVDLD